VINKNHETIIRKLHEEEGIDPKVSLKVLSHERKHSDFSASGSERWLNCSASVGLSRKVPKSPDNHWSVAGSVGHYYLEVWLKALIETGSIKLMPKSLKLAPRVYDAVREAVHIVSDNWDRETEFLKTESRISLEYIKKGVFGTGDIEIYDPVFRRLKFYDYKQGKGIVETHTIEKGRVVYNSQLMFYALGAAYKIGFDKIDEVEIGIIQPMAPHMNGSFRTVTASIKELKAFELVIKEGIKKAESKNPKVNPGKWCHWCPAKSICPVKEAAEHEKAAALF
jgi:hypothetical protein